MVKLALPLLALATAVSAVAVRAPTSATTFSFSQWVEDLIAHPDTALTPEEAIAAAQAAIVVGSAGGLEKRDPNCESGGFTGNHAYVCRPPAAARYISMGAMLTRVGFVQAPDAVGCVNYLAKLGQLGYDCVIEDDQYAKTMCIIASAKIVGSKSIKSRQAANWQVAAPFLALALG
jgi:hypothetical protein